MTPLLEGRRIRLEPMTIAHLPALEKVAFDERIWRYMTHPVNTPEKLRAWLEASLKQEAEGTVVPWVTVLKEGNRVIGSTRFLDFDHANRTTELGNTWLAPQFHGTGINPEAKLLQLTYAFEDLKLNRVALKTHHENFQSQAAMRKIGATYEGTFRNHYIMSDGSLRHSVWFSIIREDWPRVKAQLEARLGASPASA